MNDTKEPKPVIIKLSDLTQDEERNLVRLAKTEPDAMERLIFLCRESLGAVARKFHKPWIDIQDLFQQGVLGIVKAVNGFDPDQNNRFSTYSRWWIMAKMQEFYLENSRAFSVPLSVSQGLNSIQSARANLEIDGKPASQEEIMHSCGLSVQKYEQLMRCVCLPESMPESNMDSDDGYVRQFADDTRDTPAESLSRKDSIDYLRIAMQTLPVQSRLILEYRYGMKGEAMTLQETGQMLGISYECVRMHQSAAETRLKKLMAR